MYTAPDCAARAALQVPISQWRGQGAGPLAFSWGFKGDILSRERISPLFRAAPAALLSPRPAERQAFVPLQEIKQKGDLERGLLLF